MNATDRDKQTDVLLHKLWGKAKDAPDYVKEEWMALQTLIQKTQAAADPPCPRCDERDQHQHEAEDGMRNAAEIAGLQ
jgi:hypothetical protein